MIVEHFYRLKGFQKILDYGRVLPIPSMEEKANKWKKKEMEKTLLYIEKVMKEVENFIIYPSGKLKRSGLEKLGGASIAHSILQKNEEIPAVLVRATGLWGSSFSIGKTGTTPDFGRTLGKAFLVILKNFIFFVPKRKVLLEFAIPKSLPRKEERLEFNRSLEQWYNNYPNPGEEPLSLVPYSLFGKVEGPSEKKAEEEEEKELLIDPAVEKEVFSYLAKQAKVAVEKINSNLHLSFDLGLDSLDIADIHGFLDKKYDAGGVPIGNLQKVRDVLIAIIEKDSAPSVEEDKVKVDFKAWFQKEKRVPFFIPEGQTLPEVFLRSCDRRKGNIACADDRSGVLTYKRVKIAALLLAEEFRKIEEERVGVLLPALASTYITIFALFLAGKVPVMLNWTSGKSVLNHAVKVGEFKVVVTAKKFLDKITLEDLGEVEDLFLFLEDIKDGVTLKKKVKAAYMSSLSVKKTMSHFGLESDCSKTAVLLFTSGSESMPKAVPLSHRHILMNQRGAIEIAGLGGEDWLYGVLPPFHSFGLSLTGLLPILSGLRVFYSPDPTDSYKMAADVEKMGLRAVCLAPSFIKGLFAAADISQLKSVRLVISGAEKPSSGLKDYVRENLPKSEWIEGYGITECSPAVTLYPRGSDNRGVGVPLPGISLRIVDPDTLEPKNQGEDGEICIRGPSVFDGYLGEKKDPFLYVEGKRWYRSGDLGHVDEGGYLHITDRLKRTVKIGGEMISLHAVEYELATAAKDRMWYTTPQEGPSLAVIAMKTERPQLVLFTSFPIGLDEINLALRESGVGRIVKITKVIQTKEIPLTGTGKLHYRMLEEQLEEVNV
jgi:long-chain-fatty-acid--[acyl-carrier-protein] ligase